MSELVTKLCTGEHPIEVALRPEPSIAVLKECIERNFVHIRFTDTCGGTELGVPLDRAQSIISDDTLSAEVGILRFVGELNLDYIDVRCIADIALPSLTGRGRLERVDRASVGSA